MTKKYPAHWWNQPATHFTHHFYHDQYIIRFPTQFMITEIERYESSDLQPIDVSNPKHTVWEERIERLMENYP